MIQALEIFSRLAGKDQKEIRFVFFGGGPVETPKIKALCKQFPHSSHGLSLSFEQELQVIAHLDFMVAMDSGNAHLAAMYAVPTLTLWGNTHPYAGFAQHLVKITVVKVAVPTHRKGVGAHDTSDSHRIISVYQGIHIIFVVSRGYQIV